MPVLPLSSESALCIGSESPDKLSLISSRHRTWASPGACKLGCSQCDCIRSCSPNREGSPQHCPDPGTWEQLCPQQVGVGRTGVPVPSEALLSLLRTEPCPRGAPERPWAAANIAVQLLSLLLHGRERTQALFNTLTSASVTAQTREGTDTHGLFQMLFLQICPLLGGTGLH